MIENDSSDTSLFYQNSNNEAHKTFGKHRKTMILSPLLGLQLRPKLCNWFNQSRNIRPNIKIGKDKFQLQLDVRSYDKEEIRVKARPEYVVIEGKHQAQTKRGLVLRQFIRKFKLPSGCVMEGMESKLSPDGMLTITAPRTSCDQFYPYETLIPIKPDFAQNDQEASFVPQESGVCENPDLPKTPPSDQIK